MVWEHLTPAERPIFYSGQDRTGLRESQAIPTWTSIWLARYSGRNQLFSEANDLRTAASVDVPVLHGFATTIAYAYLAIQILSVRRPEGETRTPIIHSNPGPWEEGTVQIWPPRDNAQWPPSVTMGRDFPFVKFVHRFRLGETVTTLDAAAY